MFSGCSLWGVLGSDHSVSPAPVRTGCVIQQRRQRITNVRYWVFQMAQGSLNTVIVGLNGTFSPDCWEQGSCIPACKVDRFLQSFGYKTCIYGCCSAGRWCSCCRCCLAVGKQYISKVGQIQPLVIPVQMQNNAVGVFSQNLLLNRYLHFAVTRYRYMWLHYGQGSDEWNLISLLLECIPEKVNSIAKG